MRGNHPPLWSVAFLQPRAGRRAKLITATEAAKEVPAFVQTYVFGCQTRDPSVDVSQTFASVHSP